MINCFDLGDMGECPGYMFRNVYCYQSGVGMIDDALCSEDVAGKKPAVAKACDEGGPEEKESMGPKVLFVC